MVKILVLHFINSKKCTKYQLIVSEFFGQTTVKCLLSNEYEFKGVNNEPNIFKFSSSEIRQDLVFNLILTCVICSGSNRL